MEESPQFDVGSIKPTNFHAGYIFIYESVVVFASFQTVLAKFWFFENFSNEVSHSILKF